MTDTAVAASEYGADSIQALEGLEPVRTRPGMYVGGTGRAALHHLIWEVVDNSVDEAMAGHADRIDIVLNADNSVTVMDNGRGIPVAPQKSGSHKGMPTVEMVMTVLHAGGKFDDSAYAFSGGLHGVGISVVNALSIYTDVAVFRDGKEYGIRFGRSTRDDGTIWSGRTLEPLSVVGDHEGGDGTRITFLPDEDVFTTTQWDYETISRRIKNGSFLNPGLTFTLTDNRDGFDNEQVEYYYPNGLIDFMKELTVARLEQSEKSDDALLHPDTIFLSGEDTEVRGRWEMALRWYPDQFYRVNSFANGIETGNGGTHVKGYERPLTQLMNRFARQHLQILGDKDPNLEANDVRSGLGVIISVKVKDPQFVGQTKDELANEDTGTMVRQGFSEQFWAWMENHPIEARDILNKCIEEMRFRHKMANLEASERANQEKKGTAAKSMQLPAKLSDCSTRDRKQAELFIVEGDSAAGPAKKGRDSSFQAVLPIRGKGLNVEAALASGRSDRIESNKEIQGIIAALGAGSQDMFDLDHCRYGKIIVLTDADDDGAHIATLLMTTFYRLFRPMVDDGRIHVARTPLFSTTYKGEKVYLRDEEEREKFESTVKGELNFTRFKGLGEMNANQLAETSINPDTRSLARVTVEEASTADMSIRELMGKDSSAKWEALQDVEVEIEDLV